MSEPSAARGIHSRDFGGDVQPSLLDRGVDGCPSPQPGPTRLATFPGSSDRPRSHSACWDLAVGRWRGAPARQHEICLLIARGLDWPGLLTAGVTCLIVAQSTVGASAYKALLRLAGAVLGGLLGFIVIAVVMPNVERLSWLLPPVAACFWVASWLVVGSPRISYAGLQVGIAFGIAVLDVLGPTTDLVPPRDRVLGVLLGIFVRSHLSRALAGAG